MLKKILSICISMFYGITCSAFSSDEWDNKLASQLRNKYDKSDFAYINYKTTIEFEYSKEKNTILIFEVNEKEVIVLKDSEPYIECVFYDAFSENLGVSSSLYSARELNSNYKNCSGYESDGIFYDDQQVCTYRIGRHPVGWKYSISTKKRINDPHFFDKLFFHTQYPVLNREIILNIPDWINLDIKKYGTEKFDLQQQSSYDSKKKIKILTFSMKDLDPLQYGKLKGGSIFRHPHLMAIVRSYNYNGNTTEVLTSLKMLYKWYYEAAQKTVNKSDALKVHVKDLTKDINSDVDKVKAIYYWVQDNIRYIAFEYGMAGFTPEAANKVYTNKYGDCKGMANLTKEMLKLAGFDARLTWIGTKELPYTHEIASLSSSNHMICTVFLKGERYYLDATEKFTDFGDYAERIQNREVIIENGDSYLLDTVPVLPKERNLNRTVLDLKIAGDKLVGKADVTYKGESKTMIIGLANQIAKNKKDKLADLLVSRGNNNFVVLNVQSKDLENRNSEVNLHSEIEIKNYVSSFGDEIYVDLNINKEYKDSRIDTLRIFDYELGEKICDETQVNLLIPEGYDLKHKPKNIYIRTGEYTISCNFVSQANKIVMTRKIEIDNGVISKGNFTKWNKDINELQAIYNDQMVLIKK